MRVLAAPYDARYLLLLVSELPDKSIHLTSITFAGVPHPVMAKNPMSELNADIKNQVLC